MHSNGDHQKMKRKPTKQKKIFENHISNKELISIICEELMKMKVVQLCQTICNPMDYTVQGILQIRTLESLSLLQRIFSKQGLNPSLLHCRWIFYLLSHKGSPGILEWVAYPFSSESFQTRNWNGVSCIAGRFFTN